MSVEVGPALLGGGGPAYPSPAFATLVESFDSTTPFYQSMASITNGRAEQPNTPSYHFVETLQTYVLRNSEVYVEVYSDHAYTANDQAFIALRYPASQNRPGNSDNIQFAVGSALLQFMDYIDGVLSESSIPYDPVAHRWLKFKHRDAVGVTFETSPDGVNWTIRRTLQTPNATKPFALQLAAGNWNGANTGYTYFDNINGGVKLNYTSLPTANIQSWHRGGGLNFPAAPENSMSAIALAIANGANMVDLDARATADGVQVALHDATFDRTTQTTGTLATIQSDALPLLDRPSQYGSGWGTEAIPTIANILDTYGNRVFFTIEAKLATTAQVNALAKLITDRGLQNSVFINAGTTALTTAIVAAGCRAHQYGVTDTAGVDAAAAAGATIIELPYNSTTTLVDYAQTKVFRVLTDPVGTKAAEAAITPGFSGIVNDAPLYVGRPTGAYPRSSSISDWATSGKRAPGTFITGSLLDWLSPGSIKLWSGSVGKILMLGDVSGTPGATGSITMKFTMPTLPTTTTQAVRFRLMCPQEGTSAADTNTQGYVVQRRANGQINMWSSNTTLGGAATALGATPTGPAAVAGNEYTLLFEWTETQVRFSDVTSGTTTGWVNETNWRAPYNYALTTMTAGEARLTAFDVVMPPPPQTVQPTSIPSAEAFGTPTVTRQFKRQTFDNGVDGATITSTHVDSGDALAAVALAGSATAIYDSVTALKGDKSARVTGGANDTAFLTLTSPFVGQSHAVMFGLKVNALPATSTPNIARFMVGNSTPNCRLLLDRTTGKFVAQNAQGVTLWSSTIIASAGSSYRINMEVHTGSTTTDGSFAVRFHDLAGNLLDSYSSGFVIDAGSGALVDRVQIGKLTSGTTSFDLSYDELTINNNGIPIPDPGWNTPPAQTVIPTSITTAEAFGAPVLAQSAQVVAPVAISSAEAMGAPVLSTIAVVSPTGIPSAEAVGVPTASSRATLLPTSIPSAESFGAPATSTQAVVSPTGISTAEAFGVPVLAPKTTVSPLAIGSAEAFGNPSLAAISYVAPTGIPSSEAFGTPVVTTRIVAIPTGIASGEQFGNPVITTIAVISPTGIGSAEAFGTPSLGAASVVSPTGIPSAEAFGAPVITTRLVISPTGIGSAEQFGNPVVSTIVTVIPVSILSAEAFGTPSLTAPIPSSEIIPTGIASAEAFGAPSISTRVTIQPTGIPSAEAHGVQTLTPKTTVQPISIASAEAFGTPALNTGLVIIPTGIPSAEVFGVPVVTTRLVAVPTGIASAEAFGAPVITTRVVVIPTGIASAQAFGTPVITTRTVVIPTGIPSAEIVPSIVLSTRIVIIPTGIASQEAFGIVEVSGNIKELFTGWGIAL